MTAALFLAALFFGPVVAMVGGGVSVAGLYYYPITAPVVILVGSLMMAQVRRIPRQDPTEAIPAFATLTLVPFTFNIAHGVAPLSRPMFGELIPVRRRRGPVASRSHAVLNHRGLGRSLAERAQAPALENGQSGDVSCSEEGSGKVP